MKVKISIVDLNEGPDVDVDVAKVLECATPKRVENIDDKAILDIKYQ